MAIRQEELFEPTSAQVLSFPTRVVRARVQRQRHDVFLRRRIAVATVIVALALTGLQMMGAGPASATSRPGAPVTVTLDSGQTLWDLARRYAAEGTDLRTYVDATVQLNSISGAPVAGAELRLPR
jgi:nucleoid-associated protein YgaU